MYREYRCLCCFLHIRHISDSWVEQEIPIEYTHKEVKRINQSREP